MNNEDPKPIDISGLDLEKMKEKTTENPGLLPYAHTSGSAIVKAEDLGKIKGRAVTAMHQQTDMQMAQLYRQMQLLAEQAQAIKTRKEISERIYLAHVPFEPIIGHVYYLYKKDEESDTLSLIAPNEWGRRFKYQAYLAKIRLLADHTWEILAVEGEL